jgi:hypothetical protein
MLDAFIAVTALVLPWFALYLGVGIVAGPVLLRVANRTYGVPVDHLRDTPVAIMCWVGMLARMLHAEIEAV